MANLKEQAVEMLQDIPDDKMTYVIDILKGMKGLVGDEQIAKTETPTAMGVFSKYANPVMISDEKYADKGC